MRIVEAYRGAIVAMAMLLLSGCATQHVRGYQNVYQGYSIPPSLVDRVEEKLHEHGLINAAVSRDNVGRLRLVGSYLDEGEVEKAFLISQSIVGVKSTSPFYPENIRQKRWAQEAARAMSEFSKKRSQIVPPANKRALVVGINHFLDTTGNISDIQGADDALTVRDALTRAGYSVKALLGENATKANIEAALSQMSNEIGADDTVFIYFSSHGTPPVPSSSGGDERTMSIVAYDTGVIPGRPDKVADATDFLLLVQQTSVKDTLVQEAARRPSRVTRVFIDTCYSGEMLKNMPADSRAYILKANNGQVEREGISMAAWTGAQFISKGIRTVPEAAAKVPTSAMVPETRSGYAILTATSPGEKAYGPDGGTFPNPARRGAVLRGSYFTQTFFEYLSVHQGDVQSAFDAASRFTQQTVAIISQGVDHQVPRSFSTIPTSVDNLFQ